MIKIELPPNEWSFAKAKETGKVRIVVRMENFPDQYDDKVFYICNDGLSWASYKDFKMRYDVIGPVRELINFHGSIDNGN